MCWNGSGSILSTVMACCLKVTSHQENQCWPISSDVMWHSLEGYFSSRSLIWVWKFKSRLQLHLPRASELNPAVLIVLIRFNWPFQRMSSDYKMLFSVSKTSDTFTRTSLCELKITAVDHAQLAFQMLTLQTQIYVNDISWYIDTWSFALFPGLSLTKYPCTPFSIKVVLTNPA